jgi:RNA polymerase sigma factor (sigma-70 family)
MDETAGTNNEFTPEQTIEDYGKLVYFMARKFERYGLPFEDLAQIGFIALLRARDTFDRTKGVAFSKHAAICIKYAILRDMGNNSRTIRVPFSSQRLLAKVRTAREQLTGKLEREPTDLELAEYLHVPEMTVKKIKLADVQTLSINAPRGEDDAGDYVETIPDERPIPDKLLSDQETYAKLETLVSALPARQRMILEQRYGLNGGSPENLQAIGRSIRKTSERARQIEVEALNRLKGMMRDEIDAVK